MTDNSTVKAAALMIGFLVFAIAPARPAVEPLPARMLEEEAELVVTGGITELKKGQGLTGEGREKAADLRRRIEARIAAVVALAEELLKTDAVLAGRHLPAILGQLEGHPGQEELRERFEESAASDAFREVQELQKAFTSRFHELMDRKGGKPNPNHIPFLERCAETAGAQSVFGRMAGELLTFQ